MTSVGKSFSYTFQSLLKNITLFPAENFGNINLSSDSFIKNNLWLYDWNFFYGKIKVFDFKITTDMYLQLQ